MLLVSSPSASQGIETQQVSSLRLAAGRRIDSVPDSIKSSLLGTIPSTQKDDELLLLTNPLRIFIFEPPNIDEIIASFGQKTQALA
jgi:hypothetical protein